MNTTGGWVVLLDADGTLLDRQYDTTVPENELREIFEQCQNDGLSIGLNSDSSLVTLDSLAKRIGVNGPIIAEKGAIYHRDAQSAIVITNPGACGYEKLRVAFVAHLATDSRIIVITGDVNSLANRLPSINPNECVARTAILINAFRLCSMSYYVRKFAGGEWIKDADELCRVFHELQDISSEAFDWSGQDIDSNPDYGICILHHKSTAKKAGVDALLRDYASERVFMVGDSTSDVVGCPEVVQCAVGNAKDEYKKQCSFIARSSYTEGVIEVLDWI